jgi:hypothetical protein
MKKLNLNVNTIFYFIMMQLFFVIVENKGDLIPHSAVGKLFGAIFIVFGILIALLPVPILSCKFEKIYKELSEETRRKYSRTSDKQNELNQTL